MEHKKLFLSLLDKYVDNTITPPERSQFFELLDSGEYDDLLEQHMFSQTQHQELEGADIPAFRAEEMMHRILSAEKHASIVIRPIRNIKSRIIAWSVAASIAGLIILVSYFSFRTDAEVKKIASALIPENFMGEKINNTNTSMRILLEDGSIVTLKPFSSLHYPAHFAVTKREVYLEGEAFFEVSKNPSRPFFVYYDNVITHVLGTSFNVKTDKAKQLVEVSVVTGKVQVYENRNLVLSDNNRKETNGVILTPNQKVVYKEDKRQFTATLVNDPSPIPEEPSEIQVKHDDFVFKETPLSDVLKLLEKNYGIEMLTENSRLNNCLFNGDINKYNLYTKLDIICQSLNASYEINGTKILVKGPGCD